MKLRHQDLPSNTCTGLVEAVGVCDEGAASAGGTAPATGTPAAGAAGDQAGSPGAGPGATPTPPAPASSSKPPGSPATADQAAPGASKDEAAQDDPTARRLAELEAELKAQKKTVAAAAKAMRETVLDGLGVLPQYRSFAPEFDPFTDAGKKAAEDWAAKHPEIRKGQPAQATERKPRDPNAKPKNKLFGGRK